MNSSKSITNYQKPVFKYTIMKILMSLSITLIIIFVYFALTGFMFHSKETDKVNNINFKKKEQPVALKNFVIADNEVKLKNNEKVRLQLVLKKGNYYDIDHLGAGGGTYDENYIGKYELRVLDENNKSLSTFNLNKDWGYDLINFSGKFDILLSDFNGDKNPDFTIGTYGSSSMNIYHLYSIYDHGKIRPLSKETMTDVSKDFSIVFEHVLENGEYVLLTNTWNNATGEGEHQLWKWNKKSGVFEKIDQTGGEF